MTKPKKKFEYGLPEVGDQLYLEPKGMRRMPKSGFSTSYVNYNPNGSVKNIEFN